jgi:hypothetical protein
MSGKEVRSPVMGSSTMGVAYARRREGPVRRRRFDSWRDMVGSVVVCGSARRSASSNLD